MVDQRPEPASNPLMYGGILPQEELLASGKKYKKLTIGIPRENQSIEQRVSLTPEAVEVLIDNGHEVLLESKAGEGARYTDNNYSECGAFIIDNKKQVLNADVVLKVSPLEIKEIELLKGNQVILSSVHISRQSEDYIRGLMDKKSTAISIEQIRDEHDYYPVIQSMSAISGISAINIAAELLSNQNDGKGVLLGGISGITPTEVVIIGADTVAEFAARAALGLGALVRVFDNSPQKLGELQRCLGQRLLTSIFHPKVLRRALKSADVVIGALNLWDTGPRYFVTEDMVREMKRGSVVIDLSIGQGGCIETSEYRTLQNAVYMKHNVIHYSVPNLPSRVARTASIALSNILSPILVTIGSSGGFKPFLKANLGVRNSVYIYNGILTNEYLGSRFDIPSKNIDLLMAAF
jgi:alanine dehydrogenase